MKVEPSCPILSILFNFKKSCNDDKHFFTSLMIIHYSEEVSFHVIIIGSKDFFIKQEVSFRF